MFFHEIFISYRQSDDVCICIDELSRDLIYLQVWIQKTSWSWSADSIESSQQGRRHELSFLSWGSCAHCLTSELIPSAANMGIWTYSWCVVTLNQNTFPSRKTYCAIPNQQPENRVCLILQTIMLMIFLFTAIPFAMDGSESCKHKSWIRSLWW